MIWPSTEWKLCRGRHYDGQAGGHEEPAGGDPAADGRTPATSERWPIHGRRPKRVYGNRAYDLFVHGMLLCEESKQDKVGLPVCRRRPRSFSEFPCPARCSCCWGCLGYVHSMRHHRRPGGALLDHDFWVRLTRPSRLLPRLVVCVFVQEMRGAWRSCGYANSITTPLSGTPRARFGASEARARLSILQ